MWRLWSIRTSMEGRGEISSKDSIRRIPDLFKMRNEKAYTPYKFSIGPWHYDQTEVLRTGQKLKESSLERLLARLPDPAAKRRELEGAINNVRDQARECYEGGDVVRREFEEILLLDGCFIIELFRENDRQVRTRDDVTRLSTGPFSQVLYHDLLLLDNQIPWFVLELLFDKTKDPSSVNVRSLGMLALEFFAEALPHYDPRNLSLNFAEAFPHYGPRNLRHNFAEALPHYNPLNYLHLVHFLWCYWVGTPGMKLPAFEGGYRTQIPSATRLKEAGIRFRKAWSGHIFEVKFEVKFRTGVLEIPPLLITPLTENIFRNFIIFEQCGILCNPWVTCYAILLDCLIDTSGDVDLMSRAGVLVNRLNPEETANFFNRVRDNTLINNYCYASLCEYVNRYYNRKWVRWVADLNENYFSQPWALISFYLGIITLVFTIMQVYSKN